MQNFSPPPKCRLPLRPVRLSMIALALYVVHLHLPPPSTCFHIFKPIHCSRRGFTLRLPRKSLI
ncbi:MAG: hypothetical protein ACTS6P_01075 [Candidatus Hodgkinia cicadicola]